ncbi:MAG: hypothetical protein U5J95_10295 [Balneolaceae bacterium]|nr:hypothetical protein [Balneolaceae bacterium]
MPSVFFGFSIGRALRYWNMPYRRLCIVIILLAISIGGLLIEIFNLPQVYFFNHVWGYWPGPIYDESVQLTGSLFYFRGLTLFWVLLFWFLPNFLKDRQTQWIVLFSVIAIAFSYVYLSEAGIISPRTYLKQQLKGQVDTEHFEIYYDSSQYTDYEIQLIAREHEFHYQQITEKLDLAEENRKIESYLYGHPWQKKQLVGAKFTSYVPVWLDQDQLHIAKQQIKGSLKHELVHVMAKQFGNKLFNASWSIGLIEGLATAVDGGQSTTSTLNQIVYAEKPLPGTDEMEATLDPLGFYGGRSTVSYITMGSFVQYLLNNYPVNDFKKAYRSASISDSYNKALSELVAEWKESLKDTKLDSTDESQARQLFSIPSLFEKQCPHVVSAFGEAWDHYNYTWAQGDTAKALKHLTKAVGLRPQNLRVKSEWVYQSLKAGELYPVQFEAALQDSSAELQMLYADAFALDDEFAIAQNHVAKAAMLVNQQKNNELSDALATRTDLWQWKRYLELTYKNKKLEAEEFKRVYYRTKIRAIEKEITDKNPENLTIYSQSLLPLPIDEKYMLQYLSMIHHLGYNGEIELAEKWILKLQEENLRPRHKQLLSEEKGWINFLKGSIN